MTPDPFATMADIAAAYHVHPRTARRWAAADHWRRTTSRPIRYSVNDADNSWRKRRASHPRPPAIELEG